MQQALLNNNAETEKSDSADSNSRSDGCNTLSSLYIRRAEVLLQAQEYKVSRIALFYFSKKVLIFFNLLVMFLSQYVDSSEGKSFKIISDTDTETYNCM